MAGTRRLTSRTPTKRGRTTRNRPTAKGRALGGTSTLPKLMPGRRFADQDRAEQERKKMLRELGAERHWQSEVDRVNNEPKRSKPRQSTKWI